MAFLDATEGDVDFEDDDPLEANCAPDDNCQINMDEAEGDHGCDDREGDELLHGADEHDGAEPDVDLEPWLGWTEDGFIGGVTESGPDRDVDGSYITDAARQRYRPYDRWETIRDGMHVDSERGFGAGSRRIRNLSGRQRGLVTPRIADGSGVTVSA